MNADDIEAVKKVFAECAFRDFFLEVFIRGADDSDIRLKSFISSDARELAFLQDTQDFTLNLQGHFADLVQEKRALIALLESANPLAVGAGEGPFLVAKKFAFEKVVRNGRAVNGEEALVAPSAVVVDRAGDEFLSRSAFACDHDSGIASSYAADHFEDLLHGFRAAHDLIAMLLDGELRLECVGGLHFGGGLECGIGYDLEVEGELLFAHKIEGAHFHGLDHGLGGPEGAGQYHQCVRGMFSDAGEQFHTSEGM